MKPAPFDRALFLATLNPELRRQLERTPVLTRHEFPRTAIPRATTPTRRTPDREPSR